MSLKLHFMDFLVEYFPENLGDYNEQQSFIICANSCSSIESQWYAELYIKATSSRDYLING